jgi:NADH dehydrogenase/NADH:ubiquinone oxidoreductase subunit G
VELLVDGLCVIVPDGATVLEACDLAGHYVPRLCSYPGLGCSCDLGVSCGLCAVVVGGGSDAGAARSLACTTPARPGMRVTTEGPELHAERLARLSAVLDRHPHICLTCPDRDGCTRLECTSGIPVEARCCDEFGRCEIGKLIAYGDAGVELPRRAVAVSREVREEGRIRWEPGLCVGCGRCVVVCSGSGAAGKALKLERVEESAADPVAVAGPAGGVPGGRWCAAPKMDTLRASGCTFCGQCVMVCPSGAVTAPGEAGARWLEGWRRRTGLSLPVLPPQGWRALTDDELAAVTSGPGVFLLADDAGQVLRIGGVADLARGVAGALAEPTGRAASQFKVEPAELFTQRESELLARFAQEEGHLPPGNDLGDDLFADDLFDQDLE